MCIMTKKALRFELDGQRVDTEPMLIMDVPDWVTKTIMWKFAADEPGLVTVLAEKVQVTKPAKKETAEK